VQVSELVPEITFSQGFGVGYFEVLSSYED
jgi:hypothetical protein